MADFVKNDILEHFILHFGFVLDEAQHRKFNHPALG